MNISLYSDLFEGLSRCPHSLVRPKKLTAEMRNISYTFHPYDWIISVLRGVEMIVLPDPNYNFGQIRLLVFVLQQICCIPLAKGQDEGNRVVRNRKEKVS